jgi:hypothetical protein
MRSAVSTATLEDVSLIPRATRSPVTMISPCCPLSASGVVCAMAGHAEIAAQSAEESSKNDLCDTRVPDDYVVRLVISNHDANDYQ